MRETREKWMELCARAADEQDPQKLAVLILEINFMLEAEELRLLKAAQSHRPLGEIIGHYNRKPSDSNV